MMKALFASMHQAPTYRHRQRDEKKLPAQLTSEADHSHHRPTLRSLSATFQVHPYSMTVGLSRKFSLDTPQLLYGPPYLGPLNT